MWIDVSSNQISDLKGLEQFPNLQQLIIDYNYLKSLTSMPPLPNLKVLSMSYN